MKPAPRVLALSVFVKYFVDSLCRQRLIQRQSCHYRRSSVLLIPLNNDLPHLSRLQ
jgi:hypothetical protein